MQKKQWARLLAHVTGLVNQELLLQNEYLAAENRILKAHSPRNLTGERSTLTESGKRLGRKGAAASGVPERSQTTTWRDFIRRHMGVIAGTDFLTVEVLTWRGLRPGGLFEIIGGVDQDQAATGSSNRVSSVNFFGSPQELVKTFKY